MVWNQFSLIGKSLIARVCYVCFGAEARIDHETDHLRRPLGLVMLEQHTLLRGSLIESSDFELSQAAVSVLVVDGLSIDIDATARLLELPFLPLAHVIRN